MIYKINQKEIFFERVQFPINQIDIL